MASKALAIDEFRDRAAKLAQDIDRFKYNYSVIDETGKPLATAINELVKIQGFLKDAAYEQAMEELAEEKP